MGGSTVVIMSLGSTSLLGEIKITPSSDFAKKVYGTFKTPSGAIIDAWNETDAETYRNNPKYKEVL